MIKPHYINWTIMLLTERNIQISYQSYHFPPSQAPLSVNVAPVTFYDWHGWKKTQQIFIFYTKKESFQFIIAENKCNSKKSKFSLLHGIYFRAYSKPLSGATIAPNLVSWVLRKIFSLEMVKNNMCFGGASKQNALFFWKYAPKKHSQGLE